MEDDVAILVDENHKRILIFASAKGLGHREFQPVGLARMEGDYVDVAQLVPLPIFPPTPRNLPTSPK